MIEHLIDAKEAGELLHLHPKTVKRLAAAGELPALRVGRVWRFRASALDTWVAAQLDSNCPNHHPVEERHR